MNFLHLTLDGHNKPLILRVFLRKFLNICLVNCRGDEEKLSDSDIKNQCFKKVIYYSKVTDKKL